MDKNYVEFPEFKISFKEAKKEVIDLYSSLISLYMDLENDYINLNIAMDEAARSENNDIDTYVHAIHKINYLSIKIPDLADKELELFLKNIDLLDYLEEYIKIEYGIKKTLNFKWFSFAEPYIKNEFSQLKENYIILRMIRAINYYKEYKDQQLSISQQYIGSLDEDSIRDCIPYDYTDIETLNTLNIIGGTFDNLDGDELYHKYKCLFSFINPSIERYFINTDFNNDHPFIFCDFDNKCIKIIKNKIIDSMIAIQKNKIINSDDNKEAIINKNLTLKQILNIIFKFNKYDSKYDHIIDMLKNDYSDSIEEVGLLFAYMQQAYLSLDEKAVNDLDELFSAMTKKENNVKMGKITLHKKLVEHFFDKNSILKQNGYQRQRKNLNSDKDE